MAENDNDKKAHEKKLIGKSRRHSECMWIKKYEQTTRKI